MNKADFKTALQSFAMCAPDAINTSIGYAMAAAGTGLSPLAIVSATVGGAVTGAMSMSSCEFTSVDTVSAGSPLAAASAGFVSSVVCAIVPLFPFCFLSGRAALIMSAVVGALALFTVGATTAKFAGKAILFYGIRQMLIGLFIAVVGYQIPILIIWLISIFGIHIGG